MNLKRKPMVIKFTKDAERQKFFNWALGKNRSTEGISRAKAAMNLAQKNELHSRRDEMLEEIKVWRSSRLGHSSYMPVLKSSGRQRLQKNHLKRKRDGNHAFTGNNRRG
ncbi:hypothetical protein AB3U99_21335 [Niallia sp. JL1B1071]|uniref:hypothetical protein n=1 Tax=Niallia tiangongensis TaxID=3237105 RepID=UPI0037DCAD56